ncbi:hypothetical protein [Microbulbifer sp. TYP-18]|uniref:hypothetical protein n=1 Tax=Microbulbifer sp. TYP-18 TaxID=3230024 RepID=UPI0034C5CA41
MSFFETPLLQRETHSLGDTEFDLYELSAYDRCEYLEKTTGSIAMPKDGEVQPPVFERLGELWAFRREDTDSKLLLVAYALKPGREESLETLHTQLRRAVPLARIDELYLPAAKLSGLLVEPEQEADAKGMEDEVKKG